RASLFFPNVTIRFVRSPNLPANQAVFRVPPSLNKIDIQSLLTSLYGLEITDIRTMNYLGRTYRARNGTMTNAAAFKKVIVTMKEEFNFPPPVEEERDGAIRLPPRIFKKASPGLYRHLLPEPKPDETTAATETKKE
ncbi:hypothetical protein HDU76_012521, partial [Blyttiomyces sp. JEL0837]